MRRGALRLSLPSGCQAAAKWLGSSRAETEAERVHGSDARFCPVARSLEGGVDVRTELELR